jgi:hypothetical protein
MHGEMDLGSNARHVPQDGSSDVFSFAGQCQSQLRMCGPDEDDPPGDLRSENLSLHTKCKLLIKIMSWGEKWCPKIT